jgi:hypothetical protein
MVRVVLVEVMPIVRQHFQRLGIQADLYFIDDGQDAQLVNGHLAVNYQILLITFLK